MDSRPGADDAVGEVKGAMVGAKVLGSATVETVALGSAADGTSLGVAATFTT